jgi:predicted RNase H-like nuclease
VIVGVDHAWDHPPSGQIAIIAQGLCGGTPTEVETATIQSSRSTMDEAIVPRPSIVVILPLWEYHLPASGTDSLGKRM